MKKSLFYGCLLQPFSNGMNHPIAAVRLGETAYPPRLAEIPGPPETLFYRGTLPPPDGTAIAVVGTRKATREGRECARQLSRELASRGIIIVSGLAFGIDSAAHEGALDAHGKTIAVLGNGVDSIYPASHESLGRRIEASGAICSEYPPGTPALPFQFLARNRIVSGLSLAVVIVEAPLRSGALVTARHALDQGREVFVVPGPANHRNYAGSHMLIREGARLVTGAGDVLEDLGIVEPAHVECVTGRQRELPADPAMRALYTALAAAPEPLSVDSIAEITTLEPHVIQQTLTYLIFEGLVTERNGKFTLTQ
ncbi:DNA-protecting protein DprA [Candidatus Jorgensenbacteria bacterium CG10_big_fil_rev_8_21_14_0_10_54_38]|uniref:DNA-protecting protein DprA n=2 Tax=Candidatus Joergenseniibacteriota TaxID=1752739 RepID=A0A2M6WGK2_9BACT|nr:MAG: DNA-protecting protein DprA [Candidatus Jorgensenbacteria bacterium CG23_combo_of_CG06-09_8_20_14_all_54_14]PIT91844.1 MAG: DNA-protecting protein DprA [Candidatus Jorgensenbacteria bacterium CG10_big_fil_rev_8_21_14_0_10_54_38]